MAEVYCNISLFNFTKDELVTNTALAVVLQSLATLTCLFVVAFILCTKLQQNFSYRLLLYLMTTDALNSLCMMLERVPVVFNDNTGVSVREGWQGACVAIAYITQMTESAKLVIIAWIVLYLLVLAVYKVPANKPRHEVAGLLVTVAVPLLKDWLPLAWNMYGLTGMWCWIEVIDDNCNKQFPLGIGLMIAVEYGPVLITSIFTTVSFIVIIIRLRKDAAKAEISWRGVTDTTALKAGLPLIAFPLMYMCIFLFRIAHRIYYMIEIVQSEEPFTAFWLVHTIAVGLAAFVVPTAFICHPSTLKRLCACVGTNTRRLSELYRRESWDSSKEMLGSSESDPFLPKDQEPRDSLIYKSILSSTATSLQN